MNLFALRAAKRHVDVLNEQFDEDYILGGRNPEIKAILTKLRAVQHELVDEINRQSDRESNAEILRVPRS